MRRIENDIGEFDFTDYSEPELGNTQFPLVAI